VIGALVVGALLIGVSAARSGRSFVTRPLFGLELGMTVEESQAAFHPGVEGIVMVGSEDGEPSIVWEAVTDPGDGAPARAELRYEDRALSHARIVFGTTTSPRSAATATGAVEDTTTRLAGGHATLRRIPAGPDEGRVEVVLVP
jgi:hypothetical protein